LYEGTARHTTPENARSRVFAVWSGEAKPAAEVWGASSAMMTASDASRPQTCPVRALPNPAVPQRPDDTSPLVTGSQRPAAQVSWAEGRRILP